MPIDADVAPRTLLPWSVLDPVIRRSDMPFWVSDPHPFQPFAQWVCDIWGPIFHHDCWAGVRHR